MANYFKQQQSKPTVLTTGMHLYLSETFKPYRTSTTPYRSTPQRQNTTTTRLEVMEYLDFDMISHVSIFDTDAKGKPSANRIHVKPGTHIPVGNTRATGRRGIKLKIYWHLLPTSTSMLILVQVLTMKA
ncbi:hypothetical protein OK016_11345 [Vibrio chagasii]|nr:hypothetical protein [Vibrio chagasii]